MSFFHCSILNNLIHVEHERIVATPVEPNIDFVTGDFTPSSIFDVDRMALDITGSQGTTLANPFVAPGSSFDLNTAAGIVIGEYLGIESDTVGIVWGQVIDIALNTVTINRTIVVNAAAGNQAVTNTQLDGTTGFDTIEDFKFSKQSAICANTEQLRTAQLTFKGLKFFPSDRDIGDTAGVLSTGRDVSNFSVQSVKGFAHQFTDERDLSDFNNLLTTYLNDKVIAGAVLIETLWMSANNSEAVDLIIDTRTTAVPVLSTDYQGSVRGALATAQIVRPTSAGADNKALSATPILFDSFTLDEDDLGNISSNQSNSRIAIDKVLNSSSGDLYRVDFSVNFRFTNPNTITFQIFINDGVTDVGSNIEIPFDASAMSEAFVSFGKNIRGPSSITGMGAFTLRWSSTLGAGSLDFLSAVLTATRIS